MYDLGEKSTKYFLNLEKPRAILSVMHSVIINQDEIRGKVEIYKPIFSFCQSLFSHKVQIQTDETEAHLKNIPLPKTGKEIILKDKGDAKHLFIFDHDIAK